MFIAATTVPTARREFAGIMVVFKGKFYRKLYFFLRIVLCRPIGYNLIDNLLIATVTILAL